MARKRKLDKYVSPVVDRHGKERFRFRLNGYSTYLPSPSTKEYREAYEAAKLTAMGSLPLSERAIAGSVSDLLPRFYASPKFKKGGAGWQRDRKRILESFREEFGSDLIANFRPRHIDAILSAKMEQRIVKGKKVGGTHAAKRLREQLDLLFEFAVKQEWITTNPVEKADEIEHRAVGFYPWTEDDIAQFRAYWPVGTKPRLALELVLWTGARRGDAHKAAPPKGGRIAFTAGKTGKGQDLPVAPPLQAAIDAMPAVGLTTLLVTEYGKPFTVAGFGNWFKDKCVKAGLPQCSLHGLRKALARRAAERGVQQQGIKALGQWSGDREVTIYVDGANQKALAESALEAVAAWERSL